MRTYVMKASLTRISPPIWRRFALPEQATLGYLDVMIRGSMNWSDEHMHAFKIRDEIYGDRYRNPGRPLDCIDESKKQMRDVLPAIGGSFRYYYDFGDRWDFRIKLEKIVTEEAGTPARCLAGKRAAPPEDCGGVGGYYSLLKILECRPEDRTPGMRERLEWAGTWNPEHFDLDSTNQAIRARYRT